MMEVITGVLFVAVAKNTPVCGSLVRQPTKKRKKSRQCVSEATRENTSTTLILARNLEASLARIFGLE
jgi:hypothetical protein